ncbi:hypothetical protein [Proteus vulgaris]|uniref:Uncharacterized protein n=1 Tax=Proteus vulgaris TaxID=585 RepID=A0A6G6SKX5_PROVU|nr:hypothetical protein [Proteus vulgaris]QIF95192.1 hypothetical protein GTH24_15385 [Proteus vulgaris]
MGFKGTPAPWRLATMGPNGCPVVGDRTTMVAMLTHTVNEERQVLEAMSNAYLISAAPELLESLITLVAQVELFYSKEKDDFLPEYKTAKLAIAKALGKP